MKKDRYIISTIFKGDSIVEDVSTGLFLVEN